MLNMRLRVCMVEGSDHIRAWVPALPGCSAMGRTVEEAQANILEAVCGYISSFDAAVPAELEYMTDFQALSSEMFAYAR